MIIRYEDLKGVKLDWAVALSIELTPKIGSTNVNDEPFSENKFNRNSRACVMVEGHRFEPSSSWSHGGVIYANLMENGIEVRKLKEGEGYISSMDHFKNSAIGESPLESAMRCLVFKRLGFEVELPDDLAPKVSRKFRR